MGYLLDTNILSDLVRNPQGVVAARLADLDPRDLCTSVIVAAELRYGAARRGSPQLSRQVEAILGVLDIVAMEPSVSETYAEVRTRLEAKGEPIGANDLLIAAHALSLGSTLVTDNEREFRRVEGLLVENWLR